MKLQKPDPHPAKMILRKHKIGAASVARHMGLSFTYVTNLLNGLTKVTPENEAKLKEIIEYLEGRKNEKPD